MDMFPMDVFADTEPNASYELPVTYEEFLSDLEDAIFGQDEELRGIAYDIYTYLQGAFQGFTVRHNFILAGPSASGKTELYRTLKRLLTKYDCPAPVLHLDITSFSPTGFQGEELSVLPEAIWNAGSYGIAIVFLDEFDKILTPLCGAGGSDINRTLQSELLTLIEGRICSIKKRDTIHSVDTSKTLFIAMGAFTDFRKETTNKKAIGFSNDLQTTPLPTSVTISMDNLSAIGGIIELLGRFDNVYNFHPIEREWFDGLFEHLVEDLAVEQQVLIRFTEKAADDFFLLTKSQYGCREIKRVLYRTVKPHLIQLAGIKDRILYYIEVQGIDLAELKHRRKS